MPKAEMKDERMEHWRTLLAAGPDVQAALEWLLRDDVVQSVQCQGPKCDAVEGRFWSGVGYHADQFLAELRQVDQHRRAQLAEERSEG